MPDPFGPPPFTAVVEAGEDGARVRFLGELDLATVQQAEAAVAQARRGSPGALRLDLSELTFIDSSGMRLVMQVHAACRADGRTLIIEPGPRGVQRVFELAEVHRVLPFADSSR